MLGWVCFVVGHQGCRRGSELVGEGTRNDVAVVDRVLVLGERVQDDIGGSLCCGHGLLIPQMVASLVGV